MSVSSGPPCSAASTSRQSRGSKVSETWRGRGSGATVMPTRIVGATASATGSRALAPGEAGDSGGGIAAQPPVGEHVHALLADPELLPFRAFRHESGRPGHGSGCGIGHAVPELEALQTPAAVDRRCERAVCDGRRCPCCQPLPAVGGVQPVEEPAEQVRPVDADRHQADQSVLPVDDRGRLPILGEQPAHLRARLLKGDRKSTRLNSSHVAISYAVFCLKKKKNISRLLTSQY